MAIKKDALIKHFKSLHWDDAMITKYLDSTDELDLGDDIPKVTAYTVEGLTELQNNVRTKAEREALEIQLRQINKDEALGLSAADAKDWAKVNAALKTKAAKEAGTTPKDWEDKFKALQETVTAKEGEALTYKQELELIKTNRKYTTLFWDEMDDALDSDEWVERLKRHFTIKMDGDKEGLWDNELGKFVTDDKQNTLPPVQAFEKVRTTVPKYKKWSKAKVEPDPIDPDPRKRHTPNPRNPANPAPKKYTQSQIEDMVEKKYPLNQRLANNSRLRREYYQQLSTMTN